MENKWKEICYLMTINKTSAEDLFQSEIVNIFEKLDLMNSTMNIKENIDHIIIPKLFENRLK